MVIDVGGATTDVHAVTEDSDAVARILTAPEPKAKRTVEGDREYKVGDIVRFTLGYGGMLKTATSPYVEKTYINKSRL